MARGSSSSRSRVRSRGSRRLRVWIRTQGTNTRSPPAGGLVRCGAARAHAAACDPVFAGGAAAGSISSRAAVLGVELRERVAAVPRCAPPRCGARRWRRRAPRTRAHSPRARRALPTRRSFCAWAARVILRQVERRGEASASDLVSITPRSGATTGNRRTTAASACWPRPSDRVWRCSAPRPSVRASASSGVVRAERPDQTLPENSTRSSTH